MLNTKIREDVIDNLVDYLDKYWDDIGEYAEVKDGIELDNKIVIEIGGLNYTILNVEIDIASVVDKKDDDFIDSVDTQIIPVMRSVNPTRLFDELWSIKYKISEPEFMQALIEDRIYFEKKASNLESRRRIHSTSKNYQ